MDRRNELTQRFSITTGLHFLAVTNFSFADKHKLGSPFQHHRKPKPARMAVEVSSIATVLY